MADILSVDEYLSTGDIVVAWDKVHHGRFAGARLAHESDGFAFRHHEVDIAEHLLALIVAEAHVAQLDALPQFADSLRILYFLDVILRIEDFVDTLHGGHTLLDAVSSLGEVLEWLENGVENHEIINKCACIDGRVAGKNEISAKPQHHYYHACAEEFADGMGGRLAYGHAHRGIAIFVVDFLKALVHLFLSDEGLDDAQAAEGFLYLADSITPLALCEERLLLQLLADASDTKGHKRHHEQGDQVDENKDGVLYYHVE